MLENILFGIILFANWSMDSIRHRYPQSIYYRWQFLRTAKIFGYREFWLSDRSTANRRFKNEDPAQGRKKFLGITIPPFFFDGWHFWKSFLVTAVCILAAASIVHFLILGALWLIFWWLAYDLNYGTK